MGKTVPLEEVKKLIQERKHHVFGEDSQETEHYNNAVKKANTQIQELVDKYENN